MGKSDLTVSRTCMGCMGCGNAATGQHSWMVNERQAREIIRHGLDLGVNFFDTAIVYQNSASEQYVGRALRNFAKRDEGMGATKFSHVDGTARAVELAEEMQDGNIRHVLWPQILGKNDAGSGKLLLEGRTSLGSTNGES